ncbi:MATE family efflux transporter [Bowmanella sp. JS7-9]|uniref:Multidrug-efflux transporter n=1 Tax=Pseudobowmanella zhangzhouensis TaxID=1537679 RepID=A0ABW1XHT9_9ALTE|nr:MATE family efflux transporter [Bowmanella sp. JS7-9]TBX25616.1 multidrug transporter MatE [Bowmanella sp. JS7-9]
MLIKKEIPALIKLAWPLLVAQVTQMLMGVSDTLMAGRVSATDMAAVAIASSLIFPILFFTQGIILALPPIVSRLQGGGQATDIPRALFSCLWVALGLSLLISMLGWIFPWLQQQLPMEAQLKHLVFEYLGYMLWGVPGFVFYQVFRNLAEGLSQTRPSMAIMVIGLLVNIPANYVFIYGKLGMPALGGAGCGLATALVFSVMAVASWAYSYFAKAMQPFKLYQHWIAPDLKGMWEIIHLGVPIAMAILFEVSLFAVVALLLSPYGADIVASHQVALNFSSLMFMIPLSLGMATTIRIGFHLGSKNADSANAAVKSAWVVGSMTAFCTACLSVILRTPIASLYTSDQAVIQMAADLMLLAAIFQFSDAVQVISGCALRGYKDTAAMFYLTCISYWGIGLTTGCILGLTDWLVPAMAAKGFWIGFIVGLTSAAILLTLRLLYIQRTTPLPEVGEITL